MSPAAEYRTASPSAKEPIYQAINNGAPWVGTHKSQRPESHDLQLNYFTGGTHAGLTLYDMVIHDFSTYIGKTAFGHPDTNFYGYETINQNLGDLRSRGVEFEASHHLFEAWTIYGNMAYTKPILSDCIITLAGGIHAIDIVTEPDMGVEGLELDFYAKKNDLATNPNTHPMTMVGISQTRGAAWASIKDSNFSAP